MRSTVFLRNSIKVIRCALILPKWNKSFSIHSFPRSSSWATVCNSNMFSKLVQINRSMALKLHLASSLFSCVLASVSSLKKNRKVFLCVYSSSIRCCCFLLSLSNELWFLLCVRLYSCSYYLPFPDSRLDSIVHISVYTAWSSTTVVASSSFVFTGKFESLWSNTSSTSIDFNSYFIFIQYHFSSNYVSIWINLIKSVFFLRAILIFSLFRLFVFYFSTSCELSVWLTGFSLCSRCDSDVCYANRLERSVQTA